MDDTEYRIKLILDAQNVASAEITKLQGQVDKLKNWVIDSWTQFKSMMTWIKSTLASLWIWAIFASATSAIKDGIKAISEYEASVRRLEILTKNAVWATQGQVNSLVAQAEALDKVWVATKEAIIASQSQLATFDLSTKAIETLTPAIADYVIAEKWATASAEDFRQMTNGLAQALNGNYASLTRTWFILDEDTKKIIETWNEMERTEAIVKVLESTYKWFNETVARSTIEGQMIMTEKAFWDLKETVASAFIPVVQDAYAEVEWYFRDATQWIEDHQAELRLFASEVKSIISNIVSVVSSTLSTIWWMVNTFFWWVNDLMNSLWGNISSFFSQSEDMTAEGLTWMAWNWTDFFYYINQWLNTIIWTMKTLFNTRVSALKNFWLSNLVAKWVEGAKEWWFGWALNNIWNALVTWVQELTQTVEDWVNETIDNWIKIMTDRVAEFRKAWITFKNNSYTDATTRWWAWGWAGSWSWNGSKASNEAKKYQEALAKEMIAYQKALKKFNEEKEKEEAQSLKKWYDYAVKLLWEQEKKVEELKKTYEKEFDDISKKIKDSAKEIEDLNKEIDKLNESMNSLWKEENKSVASIVLDSQKGLKDLEKEFEWISDIAKSVSYDELEDAFWFFEGYSVENLKKAKWYIDNLSSTYEGLTDEQAKALDEEIEYQKRYNSLNDVQKTREDYRIKRDEIQKELDAKMKALADEMIKYAELDSDRKKLQDDWLQKIADEEKKYNDMYQNIKQYQTDYMKQLADDWISQRTMINDLEAWWKRVADARRDAQAYWSDIEWKASWGYVQGWTPYIVWENWPELFVPNNSWTIVPNNEIVNNNGITINMNWISVRSDNDINSITDEIIRRIKLEKNFWIA